VGLAFGGIVIRRLAKALLALLSVLLVQQAALAQFPAQQTALGPAYRINAGDDLQILVWGDDRLQRDVHVLPDGTFGFPLIGQIQAAGQTPAELAQTISRMLQPQYRGPVPQVTVTVKSPAGYTFSVIGKVKSPGTFTPGRYVNALEALTAAGGPTEFAQVNDITILRKAGVHLVVIRLRLGDILKGETANITERDVPFIESGDTIVVP
jgi:polysaccharide export outer membrane protein